MTSLANPSFWASLWKSATSFQFYRDIQGQTFRCTMRYVFILAAILSLLISARLFLDIEKSLEAWASWISATIPDIRIEKGITLMPAGGPKTIADDRAILVVNPEEKDAKIPDKFRAGLILGRDKMLLKWNQVSGPVGEPSRLEQFIYAIAYTAYATQPGGFKGNVFDLSGVQSLTVNPKNVARWKVLAVRLIGLTLPFVYFIFYLVGKLAQALFFSVVLSYATRSPQGERMPYSGILNLSLYALTPPMLFSALMQILGVKVPHFDWVFLGMYVAFLMGAMHNCTKIPAREEERSDSWMGY